MNDRRTFLRQLTTLPLIGGSVALIGAPSAVAELASTPMLVSYANWLFYERRLLCREIEGQVPGLEKMAFLAPCVVDDVDLSCRRQWPSFHFTARDQAQPSTRAAVVMAASGFDWRPR